jgi:hypothetical protein
MVAGRLAPAMVGCGDIGRRTGVLAIRTLALARR